MQIMTEHLEAGIIPCEINPADVMHGALIQSYPGMIEPNDCVI